MNQNSNFSDKFIELANLHPIAKWIATYYDTDNRADLIDAIERLFNLYHKQEKELLEIKKEGMKLHVPKIEIKFSESPEEIRRQMRTQMFDIKYQGYSDQYGTWSDISEVEYAQGGKDYRDVRMIYIDKK